MNCFWIENSETMLIELREASDRVAMIPLASIESHGPHLPLGSDPIVADHVMRRVAAQETVAILPTLPYSYVGEARMLPGAIHMGADLVQQMVERMCDEIYRNGFDKIVLCHMHGGNIPLHTGFTKKMLEADKPYAVYSLPVLLGEALKSAADLLEADEQGHACEMETSMNMVACPDLVRLDLLGERTFPGQPTPNVGLAATPVDWVAKYPDMAVGQPQFATKEKGEIIVKAWADAVVKHLRLIKQDQIVPREMARYVQRSNSLRNTNG